MYDFDEDILANRSSGPVALTRPEGLILLWRNVMAKRSKRNPKSMSDLQEFVVVTFVEDTEQAKEYQTLLKANDIPAVINEQCEQSNGTKGIAVMVPEDFLDEAHVVIESQDAYDDFYDFSLEDETDDDFGSDLFEDEF